MFVCHDVRSKCLFVTIVPYEYNVIIDCNRHVQVSLQLKCRSVSAAVVKPVFFLALGWSEMTHGPATQMIQQVILSQFNNLMLKQTHSSREGSTQSFSPMQRTPTDTFTDWRFYLCYHFALSSSDVPRSQSTGWLECAIKNIKFQLSLCLNLVGIISGDM